MNSLKGVIENKFSEAEQLFMRGKEPIRVESASLNGLTYEIIGLDCERGGINCFRYLVSRTSIDTRPIGLASGALGNLDDFDITNILVRFPRLGGDHRKLEDVPYAAGEILLVDAERGAVVESITDRPNQWGDFAVQALVRQLDVLRVAESLPNYSL